MIHRLIDEGYLGRSGRGLELTDKGRPRAESVVRKHRLAERFLVDIVGLPWLEAHDEADRWEHVISDDVEAALRRDARPSDHLSARQPDPRTRRSIRRRSSR